MDFGKALKKIRLKSGYRTQQEAATALKADQSYYCQLENNNRFPSKNMLNRISDTFNVPVAILFWFSLDEKGIKPDRISAFKSIKPVMDKMIEEIFLA